MAKIVYGDKEKNKESYSPEEIKSYLDKILALVDGNWSLFSSFDEERISKFDLEKRLKEVKQTPSNLIGKRLKEVIKFAEGYLKK